MGKSEINVVTVFENQTLAASATAEKIVDMNAFKAEKDNVTFQVHLAGAGSTVTLTVLASHTRGGTYVAVASKTEIVADQAVGDAVISFAGPVAPFWKIKAEETSGLNAVTDLDVTMAVQ